MSMCSGGFLWLGIDGACLDNEGVEGKMLAELERGLDVGLLCVLF